MKYQLYWYGYDDDDHLDFNTTGKDSLEEIYEFIETKSWFLNWRNNQIERATFRPIDITIIIKENFMQEDNPKFLELIESGKEKLILINAAKQKKLEEQKKEQELKQLAELKRKYEQS